MQRSLTDYFMILIMILSISILLLDSLSMLDPVMIEWSKLQTSLLR